MGHPKQMSVLALGLDLSLLNPFTWPEQMSTHTHFRKTQTSIQTNWCTGVSHKRYTSPLCLILEWIIVLLVPLILL